MLISMKNFGFKQVSEDEHKASVKDVFSSVASKYDIMNDFMSLGLHRLWKREMVRRIGLSKGQKYLDIAGGSGDIGFKVWEQGADVTITDINEAMLQEAKNKSIDSGKLERLEFAVVDAENIPFEDASFDAVGISFGIRNVTDIPKALSEFHRVLKPGGKFVCLEFSHIDNPVLAKLYDAYSFNVIPKVGGLVANDEDSYQYLVESIRKFPKAAEFEKMIEDAGFKSVKHKKLNHGVVALHVGVK